MLKLYSTAFILGFGAYAGVRVAQVVFGPLAFRVRNPCLCGVQVTAAPSLTPCECPACVAARDAQVQEVVQRYEAMAPTPATEPAAEPATVAP